MDYDEIQRRKNANSTELKAIKRTHIYIDSHADIFKYITIAVAVIGFIVGIIIGAKTPTIEYGYSKIYYDEGFNVVAMLIAWGVTAAASFGCWVIYCIFDSMDNILRELTRANEYTRQSAEKE